MPLPRKSAGPLPYHPAVTLAKLVDGPKIARRYLVDVKKTRRNASREFLNYNRSSLTVDRVSNEDHTSYHYYRHEYGHDISMFLVFVHAKTGAPLELISDRNGHTLVFQDDPLYVKLRRALDDDQRGLRA